jgi:class 3 adenylate cyclase
VVVGGATLRAVPGLRATSLGDVEVRGKREPVDAYLLETRLR